MNLDTIFKNIDPIISSTLDKALSHKEISVQEAVELFDTNSTEMTMVSLVADELRRQKVGDCVTYVVNRNINFSNVCIKKCAFVLLVETLEKKRDIFYL